MPFIATKFWQMAAPKNSKHEKVCYTIYNQPEVKDMFLKTSI